MPHKTPVGKCSFYIWRCPDCDRPSPDCFQEESLGQGIVVTKAKHPTSPCRLEVKQAQSEKEDCSRQQQELVMSAWDRSGIWQKRGGLKDAFHQDCTEVGRLQWRHPVMVWGCSVLKEAVPMGTVHLQSCRTYRWSTTGHDSQKAL